MSKSNSTLTRLDFLKISATATGGLLVSFMLPGCISKHKEPALDYDFNAYLMVDSHGYVTIKAPVPDMGQGTKTALPMMVAEELGADWEMVKIIQAETGSEFGGQSAAGSDSVRDYWNPLRKVGAQVRELLIAAAATKWQISRQGCTTKNGKVYNPTGSKILEFGVLAESAAEFEVPDEVVFKSPSEYSIIGKQISRVDAKDIITGKARYGIDVIEPDLYYASVEHAPTFTGEVVDYDDSDALNIPGVVEVVKINQVAFQPGKPEVLNGIAVIANSTWAAFKGREALKVNWDLGDGVRESSEDLLIKMQNRSKDQPADILRDQGNAIETFENAPKKIDLEFELPLLAHACLEPINCTAWVNSESCKVWVPTQNPQFLVRVLEAVLQIEADKIDVYPTMVGGGFGRRLAIDYGIEAALISRAAGGKKIKMVWNREDNVKHDYYRTANYHRVQIGLDDAKLTSWSHHLINKPIGGGPIYEVQGAADLPYNFSNIHVGYSSVDSSIRIGSWRSVAHSFNTFVVNSAIDQVARELDIDPYEFHQTYLGNPRKITIELPLRGYRGQVACDIGRLKEVIRMVAEASDWTKPLTRNNMGRGIACTHFKESYAAHVVVLEVLSNNRIKIHRIYAALDCGIIIDPNGLRAQIEGAIMDGISTVFYNNITFSNGQIDQSNFNDLPWTRITNCPEMDIQLVKNTEVPTGAGEPPYPSVAPAITNAICDATGIRIKKLPAKEFTLA